MGISSYGIAWTTPGMPMWPALRTRPISRHECHPRLFWNEHQRLFDPVVKLYPSDAFVAELDAVAPTWFYSTYLGGDGADAAMALPWTQPATLL